MGESEFFQILVLRAEILLRLDRFDQAEVIICKTIKLEPELQVTRFLDIIPKSNVLAVYAQVELALGR
jgi:hypothetical protein